MIFTTHVYKDGYLYEAERIEAISWEEAEEKAYELGVTVDGIYVGEGEYDINNMIADYKSYKESNDYN